MKPDRETLTPSQRVGGLAVIGAMLLVFGFFAWHQLTGTGFYTAQRYSLTFRFGGTHPQPERR